MGIEAVTPPGKSKTRDKPKTDTPPGRARRATPGSTKLKQQLTDLYVSIGTIAVTPIDRLAGVLLVTQAEDLAQTWIDLAETNTAVKKALQKLVEAGGWGGVIVAHGMILMPVLANRGLFPDHVAHGAAFMTIANQPEETQAAVQALFTHPRFHPNTNGNGQPD